MQKTIKQWLEELPEPYRSKALKNHAEKPIEYYADAIISDLGSAVSNAFLWDETAEGHDYWMQCCSGSYPDAEEPRTLVVLDQDKLPEPPIPELKSNWPYETRKSLDTLNTTGDALVASPELDQKLDRFPPIATDWFSCLTPQWQDRFETTFRELMVFYRDRFGQKPAYRTFYALIEDILAKHYTFPGTFLEHLGRTDDYYYLVTVGVLDELKLAKLIGTSSERAAVLNGQDYSSGQSVTFTEKHQEPFLQVEGHLMTEGVLKHLSEGLTQHEAIEADALDRSYDKIREKLYAPVPRKSNPKPDPVNHPSHYTKGDIECIDALAAATIDLTGMEAVCTANAIEYLWRWKHKNGVEDLRKAKFYIDKLITDLEK